MPQLWNLDCRTWLRNSQQVLSERGDQFPRSSQRQADRLSCRWCWRPTDCSPWTGVGWARLGGTAASEAQTHSLQRQIEEKRTKLAAGEVLKQAGPSNVKDLHSPLPIEAFTTPLDGLPPGAVEQQVLLSNGLQGSSSQPSNAWLDSRASEMFLRPAQLQRVRTLWDCWLSRQHCC